MNRPSQHAGAYYPIAAFSFIQLDKCRAAVPPSEALRWPEFGAACIIIAYTASEMAARILVVAENADPMARATFSVV